MTIKELIKILQTAPDHERDVYIPHTIVMPTSGSVSEQTSTSIACNFDDNNDFEMYIIED